MRTDEREIPGASDRTDNAPDLLEVRTSKRGRIPKREWPEVESLKPRKKRRTVALPTPSTTQSSTQDSRNSSSIFDDIVKTEVAESAQSVDETAKQTQAWMDEFKKLKKQSNPQARDYLVRLIGNDEFPDLLNVPVVPPKVLINRPFLVDNPLSIWHEFITQEDFLYIAKHTNMNAADDRSRRLNQRPWTEVTAAEIGGYFGALFLLGTQGATSLCDNWTESEDSPVYPLRLYISRDRFQQISRYLKINEPGSTNYSLKDTEFWHKVNPLVSSFRARCRANLQPRSVFAVNEQLRRNKGRWKHALQISSKADSKGMKIYSICAGYYCFDFVFASGVVAMPEVRKFTPVDPTAMPFSTSELVILTLIKQLQEQYQDQTLNLTLVCDNFFTTHKLFAELREREITAYGTAKAGSGMPIQHILLRDCTDKSTDYGLLCNSVFGGVNHVTFVDQKAVHMMTTAHDVKHQELAWRDVRSRRNACLERARERSGRTELPYPQLSYDYNNNMNSCDLASQLWSYYSVSRHSHWRNWWPMLWLIPDALIANVLFLYRLKGVTEADLSHRQLQTTIAL
jgi:hypothetical protein